ncbi:MAG: protein-L-isoaspartate(D-aspartate) O-methyltransferase [Rhodoferax sp.]|uniref:protein-L-isoaspartate(D-aspartate) O-methyltransferase n=1 Tax=Rhodoferax sp. TaxID=50421 RepID=UPI00262D24FF|nr:protein-L-isoaspartate(D-aspartate) O-methyltransferase [Rhodoferax sp.]MDD5334447.1 protein-L-isoaspartate(D-aspartate) O-methyltransferase [Rhodoferax sp.]
MNKRPSFPVRLDFSSGQAQARRPGSGHSGAALSKDGKPAAGAPPQGVGLDSGAVRMNMVRKLAGQGITDPLVLSAMGSIERHRFVDSALVNQAYEDTSLPIGLGQTISKPGVVARMAELLRHGAAGRLGRVLEIGTGCGYQAAVLSLLADEVYSIERLRGLHEKARDNLRQLRLANLHLLFGDGTLGYAKGAPYAAIIVAAASESVPPAWTDQLAVGGRLVAPVAHGRAAAGQQALLVIDKTVQGLQRTVLEAVHFVPLKSGLA